MTKLLNEAFKKAEELSNDEQDALAAFLLAEIESERRWSETFRNTQREIALLAQEAFEEYKKEETKPLEDLD